MVEYSEGYKQRAREKLEKIKSELSEESIVFAEEVHKDLLEQALPKPKGKATVTAKINSVARRAPLPDDGT